MDLEKPSAERPVPRAEGCLTVAIRLPVRIVVLVAVVPVRMVWDALVVGGRLVRDSVLRPVGRALPPWGSTVTKTESISARTRGSSNFSTQRFCL